MIYLNLYSENVKNPLSVDDRNYDPTKPRITHILWDNYDWLMETYKQKMVRDVVLENVQKVLLCNTIYLGYDAFECPVCGNSNIVCHKCHSKFCTSCGIKAQKHLAARAECMCLDVKHRHIVFTIPENYRHLFRIDRTAMNDLFIAARNTIVKLANESIFRKEKRRRGRTGKIHNDKDNVYLYRNFKDQRSIGMIATIHTFGRDLKWNPHIHVLVAEVVYDPKTDSYKKMTHFHFENLRKTWQYELNRLLKQRFGRQVQKYIDQSYMRQNKGFYVYAKSDPRFHGPHSKNVNECVNYMMRYAARPAMAESRIVSYDRVKDEVVWFYDDHKTEERIYVRESSLDLLKRMIIHIHEKEFRTVRYYGFYNNKKKDLLDTMHEKIGKERKVVKDRNTRKRKLQKMTDKLRYRTMILETYGRDILKCKCGHQLVYVDTYDPLEGKCNDNNYRQGCIDEMRKMQPPRRSIRGRPRTIPRTSSSQTR